jgi:arylsulfatase A-like enzyme
MRLDKLARLMPALLAGLGLPRLAVAGERPNFIIIFTDDQGYGDLGCYGSPEIRTPRLDRMAAEGIRFTSFYSQPVCGPARAALMTGCYPTRVMRGKWMLPGPEITLAEVLGQAGYATACIGKWDLSGRRPLPGLLPTDQGFGYYFGTLGGNDRGRILFYENTERRGETADPGVLTGMYTERAVEFIRRARTRPFFLYLAHTMPHIALGASERFRGRSKRGLYGDAVEEIDDNVGRLLDTVRECGLDDRTVILFMSDNGPWLAKKEMGGSAGPLRGGKGSAWEGGFRVPCIVRAPGRVPAGRESDALMATLDVLPTFAHLAGATLPADRVIDGRDQADLISGRTGVSARDTFFYYVQDNLHAVRKGKWKLALPGRKAFFDYAPDDVPVTSPQLYDLEKDVSERKDVARANPAILADLLKLAAIAREDVGDLTTLGRTARSRPAL